MVQIISFMKIILGKTNDVVQALSSIPVVKDIYAITGEYDLAIILNGTEAEINNCYINQLDKIKGIADSMSHLVIKHLSVNQPEDCNPKS